MLVRRLILGVFNLLIRNISIHGRLRLQNSIIPFVSVVYASNEPLLPVVRMRSIDDTAVLVLRRVRSFPEVAQPLRLDYVLTHLRILRGRVLNEQLHELGVERIIKIRQRAMV